MNQTARIDANLLPHIKASDYKLEDIKQAETKDLLILHNQITGKETKKFADRDAAEKQTWRVVQQLAADQKAHNIHTGKKTKDKKSDSKRDLADNRLIKLLVEENPKREGSRAFKKYAILMKYDGKSLKAYKAEEGKHTELDKEKGWPTTEVRWGINLGLLKLVNPTS